MNETLKAHFLMISLWCRLLLLRAARMHPDDWIKVASVMAVLQHGQSAANSLLQCVRCQLN